MEATFWGECAKYGVIGVSFGVMLFYLLRDKITMAKEMRADKAELVELFKTVVRDNTLAIQQSNQAMNKLATALGDRPCLHDDRNVRDTIAQERNS